MIGLRKFVAAFVAAAVVSACAVSEHRSNHGPEVLIDAGITGNPEIAGAETAIDGARVRLEAGAARGAA
jgi:uncharacterized membrane-anchored protein